LRGNALCVFGDFQGPAVRVVLLAYQRILGMCRVRHAQVDYHGINFPLGFLRVAVSPCRCKFPICCSSLSRFARMVSNCARVARVRTPPCASFSGVGSLAFSSSLIAAAVRYHRLAAWPWPVPALPVTVACCFAGLPLFLFSYEFLDWRLWCSELLWFPALRAWFRRRKLWVFLRKERV